MMKKSLPAEVSGVRFTVLSVQHLFAMFGATILVPILTGLDPAVALFTSGAGTLLFHLVTGGKVPAYLGSSFAFIAPIIAAREGYGIAAALGGCVIAGLVYLAGSALVRVAGPESIARLLPPVVVGPVIIVIGLILAGAARIMSEGDMLTAMVTLGIAIAVAIYAKGFFKIIPILLGIGGGYLFALARGLVDFSTVAGAAWISLPRFVTPAFHPAAISLIAPVAIATMVEHVGDVLVIGRTVGKNFTTEPGLHRTLLGDGLATSLAGLLGGPPNTTYGENIGVLAITGVYNPAIIRLAAVLALSLSFVGKLGALIGTIPDQVMGGICVLLFGMIASVGVRTLVENRVDLANVRNLVIASTILVVGIGKLPFHFGVLAFEGVGPAAIIGIILNQVLPNADSQNSAVGKGKKEAAAGRDLPKGRRGKV
ncbi:MAG: solute carrier family 23 protein [Bacillota bacterium]